MAGFPVDRMILWASSWARVKRLRSTFVRLDTTTASATDPPLSHGPARQAADALGEVSFDHLDPLFLQEGAQAGHRIHAQVLCLAELIGYVVDLGFGGDAVAAAVLETVARRRNAENLLDGQIPLEVVDQDGFGSGTVAGGSARVLAEHEAVEDVDPVTHEEVQRDIERLAEADQNSRRGDVDNTTRQRPHIMELIDNAPWREAVTYRKTWPHEYVVVKKDGQEELLAAFCERIGAWRGCRGPILPPEVPVPVPRRLQSTGSWWNAGTSTSRRKTRF